MTTTAQALVVTGKSPDIILRDFFIANGWARLDPETKTHVVSVHRIALALFAPKPGWSIWGGSTPLANEFKDAIAVRKAAISAANEANADIDALDVMIQAEEDYLKMLKKVETAQDVLTRASALLAAESMAKKAAQQKQESEIAATIKNLRVDPNVLKTIRGKYTKAKTSADLDKVLFVATTDIEKEYPGAAFLVGK